MRKTAEQMAQELKARGFNVKLYYRKEGGARITSINGKAYTGSTGTKEARKLLGEALSEKQTKHLEKIRTKKGHFGHTKQAPIPKHMLDLQKKINSV